MDGLRGLFGVGQPLASVSLGAFRVLALPCGLVLGAAMALPRCGHAELPADAVLSSEEADGVSHCIALMFGRDVGPAIGDLGFEAAERVQVSVEPQHCRGELDDV